MEVRGNNKTIRVNAGDFKRLINSNKRLINRNTEMEKKVEKLYELLKINSEQSVSGKKNQTSKVRKKPYTVIKSCKTNKHEEKELSSKSVLTDINHDVTSIFNDDFTSILNETGVVTGVETNKTPVGDPDVDNTNSSNTSISNEPGVETNETLVAAPDVDTTARKVLRAVGYVFMGIGAIIASPFALARAGIHFAYNRLTKTPDLGKNDFSGNILFINNQYDKLKADFENTEVKQTPERTLNRIKILDSMIEADILSQLNKSEVKTPLIRRQIKEVKSLVNSLATLKKQVEEWAVRVDVSNMINNTNLYLERISENYANGNCVLEEYTRGISAVLFAIHEEIEQEPAYKKALKDPYVAKSLVELKTRAEDLREDVQKSLSTLIQEAQKKHRTKLELFDSEFTKYIKFGHAASATMSRRNAEATQADLQKAMLGNLEAMDSLKAAASAIDKDHRISKHTVHPMMESASFVHERNKIRLEGRTTLYSEVAGLVSALSMVEKTRNGAESAYKKVIADHEKNLKEIKTLAGRIKKVEDRKFKDFAKLEAYSECARGTLARFGHYIYTCFASYRSQLKVAQEQHDLANQKAFNFYKNNVKEIENAKKHIGKYFDLINTAEQIGSDSYKESAVLQTFKRLEDEERRLQKEVDRLESIIAEQNKKENLEAGPLYAPGPKKSFFASMNPWAKDAVGSEDMDRIGEVFTNPINQSIEPEEFNHDEQFSLYSRSSTPIEIETHHPFAQTRADSRGEWVIGNDIGSQYDDSISDDGQKDAAANNAYDRFNFNPEEALNSSTNPFENFRIR